MGKLRERLSIMPKVTEVVSYRAGTLCHHGLLWKNRHDSFKVIWRICLKCFLHWSWLILFVKSIYCSYKKYPVHSSSLLSLVQNWYLSLPFIHSFIHSFFLLGIYSPPPTPPHTVVGWSWLLLAGQSCLWTSLPAPQWHPIGGWKSATVGTFISQKLTNAKHQGCFFLRALHIYQLTPAVLLQEKLCLSLSSSTISQERLFMAPARLLWPWNFPGKNTGVGCHFLPQGIFPT